MLSQAKVPVDVIASRISFHLGFASVTRRLEENNPLFRVQRNFVPQAFGLSTALVRNWSSLFLNKMLNVVSDP